MIVVIGLTVLIFGSGVTGCAKHVRQNAKANSASLAGNWETHGLYSGQKTFLLSEGGTGIVDTIGDNMKPDLIMSWSFDGANFTYTTHTIDRPDAPALTRTYRCVLSADGNSFRLLSGDKGFDADPIAKNMTTYYRTEPTTPLFPSPKKNSK